MCSHLRNEDRCAMYVSLLDLMIPQYAWTSKHSAHCKFIAIYLYIQK